MDLTVDMVIEGLSYIEVRAGLKPMQPMRLHWAPRQHVFA